MKEDISELKSLVALNAGKRVSAPSSAGSSTTDRFVPSQLEIKFKVAVTRARAQEITSELISLLDDEAKNSVFLSQASLKGYKLDEFHIPVPSRLHKEIQILWNRALRGGRIAGVANGDAWVKIEMEPSEKTRRGICYGLFKYIETLVGEDNPDKVVEPNSSNFSVQIVADLGREELAKVGDQSSGYAITFAPSAARHLGKSVAALSLEWSKNQAKRRKDFSGSSAQ